MKIRLSRPRVFVDRAGRLRKGVVISIPLYARTQDEPRPSRLQRIWRDHVYGKNIRKV